MNRCRYQNSSDYLRYAFALALFIALDTSYGQSVKPESRATPSQKRNFPKMGAIYVNVITDETGAVARLDFLNEVPAEIQEDIRRKTLGRHFGVPNHSYRRNILYEVVDPPKTKQRSAGHGHS